MNDSVGNVDNESIGDAHDDDGEEDEAESEKPRRRVGIADRKVFARLESFCAYLQNWLKINSKHRISLEGFHTIWRYTAQSGKFRDSLEKFRRVWALYFEPI